MSTKKLLKACALIVLIPAMMLVTGISAVYFYRDNLVQKLVSEVNERIDGTMLVQQIRLTPFASLPYFSIDLREVEFYASKDTDEKPVYTFGDVYLGFDVLDLLTGHINIKSLRLENGHLDIVRNPDGSLNLLTAKGLQTTARESSSQATPLNLSIYSLMIRDVDIDFQDRAADQQVTALIDDMNATINYRLGHFYIDLVSDLHVGVMMQGLPAYFSNMDMHLDLEGDYDESTDIMQVLPSLITLNGADFRLGGRVDIGNNLNMDLQFRGDKPDFSLLGAFMPGELAAGLERYQNAGAIFFEGSVVGEAGNGEVPAVEVVFGSEGAWFLNTETVTRVDEVRFTGSFSMGEERSLRSAELLVSDIYAKPDEGVFQGHLAIKNFVDPVVKMDVHADLDLEFLARFLQMSELEHVRGKILLDMNFDEIIDLEFPGESLAQLQGGLDSELFIRDLHFLIPEYGHTVSEMNGHAIMRDGVIALENFSFRIDDSDVRVMGSLSDFPALFHRQQKPLRLELEVGADRLDFTKLLAFDEQLARQVDEVVENFRVQMALEVQASELFEFEYLPKGRFIIEDFYASFQHYPHVLHDFDVEVRIGERDLVIIDFSGEIDDTDFHFSGSLDNYPKWFQEQPEGISRIEFDLVSEHFKLADLLSYRGQNYVPESYRDEVFQDTKLHGRVELIYDNGFQAMDLHLDELTSQTRFHPLKLQNFNGRAHYEAGHFLLEEFSGQMGESDFHINMSYFFDDGQHVQARENYLIFKSDILDLDTLTGYDEEEEVDHEKAFNIFEVPFPNLQVKVDVARLNYHRYWLEDMQMALRIQEDHFLHVDNLAFGIAGGDLSMTGYFNGSDPAKIYYHSDIHARDLDIDKLMIKFDNFGQDALINENVHGRITGRIESTFRMHPDLTPILEESEAHIELEIADGSLVNFAPAMALSDFFSDRNLSVLRFDKLQNTLDLKNGSISIPAMLINSSIGFLEISGSQNLDASMEYFVRVPLRMVTQVAWRKLFGGRSRQEVDPDQIDEIETVGDTSNIRFLNVRISGTPEEYTVNLGRKR
jgi:hypothetical protein